MAKQLIISSAWVILIVSVTTVAVNLATQTYLYGEGSGLLVSKVDGNTAEIVRIDERGTKVVQEIKIDLTQIDSRVERNSERILELNNQINNQYHTIIDLLERE